MVTEDSLIYNQNALVKRRGFSDSDEGEMDVMKDTLTDHLNELILEE